MATTNPTHDPSLKSWVESANDPATDFPIQNLALCAFEAAHDGHTHDHLGVAIGDQVLDLGMLVQAGVFDDNEGLAYALHLPSWNMIAASPLVWSDVRARIQDFLRADRHAGAPQRRLRDKALRPASEVAFSLPMVIGDYTDFYASKHHASNVGAMFRPDNPLLPNYTHVPIGYHGRSSSIVPSGTDIRRPRGQTKADDAASPTFGPCKMLDYEMELGVYVGEPNDMGDAPPISSIASRAFGMTIVNDWSARDIQKWEYQPLGPFLAKNFATSVSPFIVTLEALAPFRIPGPERTADDPKPLDYLHTDDPWGLDITVEVWLQSAQMRDRSMSPIMLSRGNFKHMYWTIAQLLTHHTSNGCNLSPGDLLASGTISGPEKSSRGCLLELTWDAPESRVFPSHFRPANRAAFLADGDEVIMKAYCQRDGLPRIGFGDCRGRIIAAH